MARVLLQRPGVFPSYTGDESTGRFGDLFRIAASGSMNGTARKVLLRSPTIVSDPSGQTCSLEQIRALLYSG